MNKRSEIRNAIVQALIGETDAGDNVFNSLASDISEDLLPAIAVRSGTETPDLISDSPRSYKCALEIDVQCWCAGVEDGEGVQDAVDAMASRIEAILDRNKLGDLLEDLSITSTEEKSELKGKYFGSVILKLEASYYT